MAFDYLNLEGTLTEEEERTLETAREFVEDEVKPYVGDWFEEGRFPEGLLERMGELGFYAPNIDAPGFPDLSERAYGLVMQELEAGDSAVRSAASVQGALVTYPVHR
ncbi:MAG: acyl-CoA dehydrogenase family protein, partial [Halobacteria archaeon]|nr:acyl-CoA dehydrogenase family protein [Halobacteria archaeon]